MVKSIAMFLFVVAAVATTATPAAAATRCCSPLPVQVVGPFASCKCAVQELQHGGGHGRDDIGVRPQRRLHDVAGRAPFLRERERSVTSALRWGRCAAAW